jgi:hypothetical protein
MTPIHIILAGFASIALFAGVATFISVRMDKKNREQKKLKVINDRETTTQYVQIAKEILGFHGSEKLDAGMFKQTPAIWGASIRVPGVEQEIWNGHIDIWDSREKLLELSKHIGKLYVFRGKSLTIDDTMVIVEDGRIWFNDEFVKFMLGRPKELKRMQKIRRKVWDEKKQKTRNAPGRAKKIQSRGV